MRALFAVRVCGFPCAARGEWLLFRVQSLVHFAGSDPGFNHFSAVSTVCCLLLFFVKCGCGVCFVFTFALRFTTSPVIAQIYMRFFSLRSQRDATLPKGEGKTSGLFYAKYILKCIHFSDYLSIKANLTCLPRPTGKGDRTPQGVWWMRVDREGYP